LKGLEFFMDVNFMVVVKTMVCAPLARARIFAFALMLLAIAVPCGAAGDLRGRVINGTTRDAAGGDEVILLSLANGKMTETTRTQTDSTGSFTLPIDDPDITHLVRVIHQGVTYHNAAKADAGSIAIVVYDVTPNPDGVNTIMDVERLETVGDQLEIKQLVTMRNQSNPPRTLMAGRTFEVQLPPQSQVQYGLVQVGEEQPLKQRPISGNHRGQYYFTFPMRPGDTRFAIVYRVPYKGGATIQPTVRNPHERFVVMLPKSMKFEPMDPGIFKPLAGTTPDNVQGTDPVALGQTVSFRISGTGTLAELQEKRQINNESMSSTEGASRPRPGGGLGAPIGSPDPLYQYRWLILASMTSVLIAWGAITSIKPSLSRALIRRSALQAMPAAQTAKLAHGQTDVQKGRRQSQIPYHVSMPTPRSRRKR
jgi:hypothetical protein